VIGAAGILAGLTGHAQATGWFDTVLGYEPKSAPGNGLTATFWVAGIGPAAGRSGLVSTTARVEITCRVLTPMLAEPAQDIDPRLLLAVDGLMGAYSGDFTLGGIVAYIDLMGAHGDPLTASFGYLSQDQKLFRAFTLTIPVIVNDLWAQSP